MAVLGLIAAPAAPQRDAAGAEADESEPQMQAGVVESMERDHAHMHGDPHLRFTPPRASTPEELARADRLIAELRPAIEKYRDYRVAQRDGYRQFLPNREQPMYHFTNYLEGFLENFRFNPIQPTSLLYKKTPEGFELVGAMYTASKRATEEELDRRVPLSVATWHAHVNICLPPKARRATADWTKFGPKGSISTEAACEAAGGTFHPQLFGWMVHVHPFETTREKIWAR
ncbi:MAG: hypothetical protein AB1515_03545 [Nitrospirota bacterium]